MAEPASITLHGIPVNRWSEVGDLVRLEAWVQDASGALVAPSSLSFEVSIEGNVSTSTLVSGVTTLAPGKYTIDVVPEQQGPHFVRVRSGGNFIGQATGQITVREPAIPSA